MYINFDTGEACTWQEIESEFKNNINLQEKFETVDEYIDYLLGLGRQMIGGIKEV